jgi:cyclic beta-1,2-glucan synthetase
LKDELHTKADAPRAGHPPVRDSDAADRAPLRAARFDAAQMAEHARRLATGHVPAPGDGAELLLARLAGNETAVTAACAALTRAGEGHTLPAAERLLAAYRRVKCQIHQVRRELPPACSRALPRLGAPKEMAGQTRAYALALELVMHGDGLLEQDILARFIAAYQESAPLALGELRALPAMLRLALIDNLRRLAVRLDASVQQRALAGEWAARLFETAERRPGDLLLLVADMARAVQPLTPAFVAELARRLAGQGPVLAQVLQWIGARLADDGFTIEAFAERDTADCALDADSLAHSLASFEVVARIDWPAFVETASAVERLLRRDPAGVYARMDGATREHYRHAVERLACESGQPDTAVAAAALALAEDGTDERSRHVGHYLVGDARPALRARFKRAPGVLPALRRAARRRPLLAYLGAIGTFTLLFTAALLVHAWQAGAGAPLLAVLGLLVAFGASQLALEMTDLMAARLVAPKPLPRLDFSGGIPVQARTLVAVPALLRDSGTVKALCEGLELRYLANRDPQLRFCLLTDFDDAPDETMFGDAELLEEARAAIAALNARYASEAAAGPFLLLHRPRVWSTSEHAWIGCERKRGKLADLNAFLRGGARERFMLAEGRTDDLHGIRYVITLDADTQLPADSARQMVAAMAHPLNRPVLDAAGRRVVAGHALLQPRMTASLPRAQASRYERLLGGTPGIDPWPRTASNVHQDLFGEGSYIGKGIYEVDTCMRVLAGRLPDNAVLSHDLLEGCYLRSGVLSDTQLVEAGPSRYSDDIARRHRRIRGDWQLAGWLRARVPRHGGGREPNPLTPLSRWKLFDKLRRSLVAPALGAMLVLCWSLLPGPAFWSAAALSVFFLPAFFDIALALVDKPHDLLWRQHLPNWARGAGRSLSRAVMGTAFLPHEAWYSLHAIVRTGWRMLVSRRHLLQWRSSNLVRSSTDVESAWRSMWFAPLFPVVLAVVLSFLHPFALFVAAPLLLLWFLSPLIAWWVSLPFERPPAGLAPQQTRFLAQLARRSWAYFEDVVGPGTSWLAPAGIHERPEAAVVPTTSPTHIGLSLLANLTAWDFGFVPQATVLVRVRAAFESMALLERHHGHFYAAYDTRTLAPLQPVRIATVDSGNLAGHLLTLATGLEELLDAPIAGVRSLDGMRATLDVIEEHAQGAAPAVGAALEACRAALDPERCRNGDTLPGLADCLDAAVRAASTLLTTLPQDADARLRDWATRLDADCRAARDDLLAQAPWMRAAQEYVLESRLTRIPTLAELAALATESRAADPALAQMVEEGAATARARLREIATLAACARAFAAMDFGWLLQRDTLLLAPGYDVGAGKLEAGACDLLASTARLASFVGVAQGQLPLAHWRALGRTLGIVGGEQLLLSPHGAMIDYLMPQLVMPGFRDALIERSCRAAVRVQIAHAARHGIPWGMSDAACYRVDGAARFELRPFGVPGAGMAHGRSEELVVAPYASLLALMVAPQTACANLERVAALGGVGRYGVHEAIDFTGARLPRGQSHAVVRAYASDHQAIGLLALSALLHGRPMQARFEADPQLRAALLLLQEPVPVTGAIETAAFELDAKEGEAQAAPPVRSVTRTGVGQPQLQLLSNGRYHVMVDSDGGGYSRLGGLALTRWRFDATCDDWGLFCYLRDLDSGELWSGAWQPTLAQPEHYEAVFAEEQVQLRRRDHGIELVTDIVVAREDDVELRRMRIKNLSGQARRIELTSYTEPVLAPPDQDDAHPAFSKLFVQSEIVADRNAILCTRRPRAEDEQLPVLLNAMAVHGTTEGETSFETSRADFVGRTNRNALPVALATSTPLDGAAGSVLDPALVIRRVLTLAPGAEATVDMVLGVAETRDAALQLADKYARRGCVEHAFDQAWAQGQALLQSLHVTEADAQLYARLAGAVLYPQRALRADPGLIAHNARGQSGLWPYGISGDLPIVLLRIEDAPGLALARQLLQAHAWWRRKGLQVDLVIWCRGGGEPRSLHAQLIEAIKAAGAFELLDRAGGAYLQVLDQVPEEDQLLLQAVARVVLLDERGGLAEQLQRAAAPALSGMPPLQVSAPPSADAAAHASVTVPGELLLDNGIGGFSPDGREYVIRIAPGRPTPAPWSNVLASPAFGSVVSESGQAYSWSGNAHSQRLTPWENDPVGDRGGEVFYVRDEVSGVFWSPTALPAPSGAGYLTRHGFGYSVFEHRVHGIHSELTQFVAQGAALKYSVLRVRNDSPAPRRLSATGYVEWVLGESRAASSLHVVTERDPVTGALCARNAWNGGEQMAFFHVDAPEAVFTCDRAEFIGRGGHLGAPQALGRAGLSGSSGAGFDPCAALQVGFELAPGEERELVFMLGAGGSELAQGGEAAKDALVKVREYWEETLGAVRIESPDPSVDVLVNGWLVYQTLACRMWARSAYYQSGGAYGFRDQLQDAMALVHTRPQLLRDHLLLCAAHQFVEGDVQHWWHPPASGGVRTRCSDDLLWLPLATCRYIRATGDFSVLGESAPYLEGRALDAGEESYFDLPRESSQRGDLYEHCVRAIRHSLRFGEHGLPLIGSGDWNDGLDRVGSKGRGESVWLGFFMVEVLSRFAEVADRRADYGFATTCRAAATALGTQLEHHAWDGEWYRRAWFDDGTPLGSKDNKECRIDLVSQSWSVLSGAAGPERAASAMAAVDAHLVWPESRLVKLLDPPFEAGSLHPGTLRAYAPGVRDNGGQATHAALWCAMAFARMGNTERAWELFEMLNPVRLAATMEDCARYRLEPYAVAGDVHAAAPHVGRGGWSWYTGSAGWMYRLLVESLLGIERVGERLVLAPQLPRGWPGFRLQYRYRATSYAIDVRVADSAALYVDGVDVGGDTVQLHDDGQAHRVELHLVRRHEPALAPREQAHSKTIT